MNQKKKALITGVTGQDGSYLAELLLEAGYDVHAIIRRTSNDPTERLNNLFRDRAVTFHQGDIRDLNRVSAIMDEVQPDEVYNLAAQSHVGTSFKCPDETHDINYYGVGRVVNEALRVNPNVRIYQASTSEMFGNSPAPQNELTPFDPQSPYAEAKLKAHTDFIVNKRTSQNAFTVSGILFNHESPRRGKQFVTRKITYSLAKIAHGLQDSLQLGNLDAVRDWSHAKDCVRAMIAILNHHTPLDFVVASGEAHSVRDFVNAAAEYFNIQLAWEGEGVDEVGIDTKTGKVIVSVNPEFYRPREVNYLQGDSSKARSVLGWTPEYSFEELVEEMAREDAALVKKEYGL